MAYNRVNWEDGEKIADGYVTINGQNYTTVEPVYQGQTATSADNLNVMDKGIKYLDETLENNSTLSCINENFIGYWIDSSRKKHERYQIEMRFPKSSLNPNDSFSISSLNADKILKFECYYDVSNAFVSLPFTANSSGSTTPQHLSARILKNPDQIKLFGNLTYDSGETFIARIEYTKKS